MKTGSFLNQLLKSVVKTVGILAFVVIMFLVLTFTTLLLLVFKLM